MLRYHRTESGRSIAAGWAFASVDPRRARSLQFAILLLAMLVLPVRPLGAAAQSNPDAATGPVIVTFATPDGSTFRTLLEQPADVAAVRAALAGDGYAGIPNGTLAYGDGGINAPHGWHMQGTTLADVTIELCDGTASMVDEDLTYWVETVGQYCPWSATVVAVEPVNPPDDGGEPGNGGGEPGTGGGDGGGPDSGSGDGGPAEGTDIVDGAVDAGDTGGTGEAVAVALPNTGAGTAPIGSGGMPLVAAVSGILALMGFAALRHRFWARPSRGGTST